MIIIVSSIGKKKSSNLKNRLNCPYQNLFLKFAYLTINPIVSLNDIFISGMK